MEPCRPLERLADVVHPYYAKGDFNDYYRMVNNASLSIVGASGLGTHSEILGIPLIALEQMYEGKDKDKGDRTDDGWATRGGYGKSYNDWIDPERYIIFFKDA